MDGWFSEDAQSDLEERLRSMLQAEWGEFPPDWVLETDRGDERPLFSRYSDFEVLREANADAPEIVLRMCLDAVRQVIRWAAEQHEVLQVALTLDDFDDWESGDLPVPFVSLLIVKRPDEPVPDRSNLSGDVGQAVFAWLEALGDRASDIVAVEGQGKVFLYPDPGGGVS